MLAVDDEGNVKSVAASSTLTLLTPVAAAANCSAVCRRSDPMSRLSPTNVSHGLPLYHSIAVLAFITAPAQDRQASTQEQVKPLWHDAANHVECRPHCNTNINVRKGSCTCAEPNVILLRTLPEIGRLGELELSQRRFSSFCTSIDQLGLSVKL